MDMNIICKFEKSTYNTLASRGVTRKSLHTAVAAYSCIIHSIHWILYSEHNRLTQRETELLEYRKLATDEVSTGIPSEVIHHIPLVLLFYGNLPVHPLNS